MSLWPY